jgi:hypothetical protein
MRSSRCKCEESIGVAATTSNGSIGSDTSDHRIHEPSIRAYSTSQSIGTKSYFLAEEATEQYSNITTTNVSTWSHHHTSDGYNAHAPTFDGAIGAPQQGVEKWTSVSF